MVLCDLHRPDATASAVAACAAASLSRAGRYRVRQSMGCVGAFVALARTRAARFHRSRLGCPALYADRKAGERMAEAIGRESADGAARFVLTRLVRVIQRAMTNQGADC